MPGYFTNLVLLESVDSTNRFVADEARAGASQGLVVVADRQEAGRGRRGRSWIAPERSAVLCSMLFRPTIEIDQWHVITSAVALSIAASIGRFTGCPPSIKWPNDLVYSSKKAAGILAESVETTPGAGPDALVVGFGVNLFWPDGFLESADSTTRELLVDATTLERESGVRVVRDDLVMAILGQIDRRYEALSTAEGRAATMEAYRSHCSTIGTFVRIDEISTSWRGQAIDVADDGRLQVRRGSATVSVDAADVVHLRVATED